MQELVFELLGLVVAFAGTLVAAAVAVVVVVAVVVGAAGGPLVGIVVAVLGLVQSANNLSQPAIGCFVMSNVAQSPVLVEAPSQMLFSGDSYVRP
jgi:LytS/YehU family sensor histidine kinase